MNETNLTEAKSLIAEMLRDGAELKAVTGGSFTDAMADWLGPQYLLAARDALSGVPSGQRWEILRAMVQDWAGLRRGDHWAARLQLEREALDWKRANGQAQKEAEFREWVKRPEIRKELFPERTGGISAETMALIEEKLNLL